MMFRYCLLAVASLVLAYCGSDGPTGPQDPANGSMSAQIDGSSWRASFISPGIGTNIAAIGGNDGTRTIAFAWGDEGVGTYEIGTSIGFNGSLSTGGAVWVANNSAGSGTLVVTTRTENRIAGTFTFTMQPGSGNASGTKTITQGEFNITF